MNKKLIWMPVLLGMFLLCSVFAEEIALYNVETRFNNSTNQTIFVFNASDSSLRINGHDYWNIVPGGIFKTSSNKTLIEANFSVNEKGGTYFFGNDKIALPANSTIFFSNGTLNCALVNGSKIELLQSSINSSLKVIYSPKESATILLPGNLTLNSGKIVFLNNTFSASAGENTTINGIGLYAHNSSIDLFFNNTPLNKYGVYFINQSNTYFNYDNCSLSIQIGSGDLLINSTIMNMKLNLGSNNSRTLDFPASNLSKKNSFEFKNGGEISNGRISYKNVNEQR
jgi:hypothetical protein